MIVFGWYSWAIRNYMPHQLGLQSESFNNIQFEVRQKCFHVFWIPFFSIGKMYIMRKEGKMYEVTPEFEQYMRSLENHKTPWYAFLGLILIPVSFLFYWGNEKYEDYKHLQNRKAAIAQKFDRIDNPQAGDYYRLASTDGTYKRYALKVDKFTKDSVAVIVPAVMSGDSPYFYNFSSTDVYFDNLGSQTWTLWIAKNDLKKMIDSDPNYSSHFEGMEIPDLVENEKLSIDDIFRQGD